MLSTFWGPNPILNVYLVLRDVGMSRAPLNVITVECILSFLDLVSFSVFSKSNTHSPFGMPGG